MKLGALKQGDKFRYAGYPDASAIYVKGGVVPGSLGEKFYVHSTVIGHIYMGDFDDEVVRVGNIND